MHYIRTKAKANDKETRATFSPIHPSIHPSKVPTYMHTYLPTRTDRRFDSFLHSYNIQKIQHHSLIISHPPISFLRALIIHSNPIQSKSSRIQLDPNCSNRILELPLLAGALEDMREVADGDAKGEIERGEHDGEEDPPAGQGGDEGEGAAGLIRAE